MRVMFKRVSTT